jgi:hypothetical protein
MWRDGTVCDAGLGARESAKGLRADAQSHALRADAMARVAKKVPRHIHRHPPTGRPPHCGRTGDARARVQTLQTTAVRIDDIEKHLDDEPHHESEERTDDEGVDGRAGTESSSLRGIATWKPLGGFTPSVLPLALVCRIATVPTTASAGGIAIATTIATSSTPGTIA